MSEVSQTDSNDLLKTKEEFYKLPLNEILSQLQILEAKCEIKRCPFLSTPSHPVWFPVGPSPSTLALAGSQWSEDNKNAARSKQK